MAMLVEEETAVGEPSAIAAEDLPLCVVVTGLPIDIDPEKARLSLDSFFMEAGEIKQCIFQSEANQQHAVILFQMQESVKPACSLSGCTLLGASVNVVAAQELGQPNAATVAPSEPAGRNRTASYLVKNGLATGLATGFVLGKELDDKLGLSKSVNALDKQFKVKETVNQHVAVVTDTVKNIDQEYGVSKKTTEVAGNVAAQVKYGANKALEHPVVKSGWSFASNVFKTVAAVVTDTVQDTEKMTKAKIDAKLGRPTSDAVVEDVADDKVGGPVSYPDGPDSEDADGPVGL